MAAKFILFAVLAIVFIVEVAESRKSKKDAKTTEIPNGCSKYEKPIRNSAGEQRCIPLSGSCHADRLSARAKCHQSPCRKFGERCPQAAKCFKDPCFACSPLFFDAAYNKVCIQKPETAVEESREDDK